jgi:hypothetical protein
VRFLWEVVDPQSLSPCFSHDDDKQGRDIFPDKALHALKRWPLHGLAFLPEEAAKQEGPEEISPLFFREMTQRSSMRGLLLRAVLGAYPVFSERMSEVASTRGLALVVQDFLLLSGGRKERKAVFC